MTKDPFYLSKLEDEFARRQRQNPAYSLRAFARFLNIDASSLAAVFKRKRKLPSDKAQLIVKKLGFSPIEKQKFLTSLQASRASLAALALQNIAVPASTIDEERHFRIISEWEHYAVLTLAKVEGFQSNTAWIANRLGISELRARSALNRLLEAGLLKQDAKKGVTPTHARITTTEDIASESLRQAHKEALEMGARKLDTVEVLDRDYSIETLAFDPGKLGEAKALIREFREKLGALVQGDAPREVYQFCIQLYPLTQLGAGQPSATASLEEVK